MKNINPTFLRETALDYGPRVSEWPAFEKRAAVSALYRHHPDFLADALSEIAGNAEKLAEVQAIFTSTTSPQHDLDVDLGVWLFGQLVAYPIPTLERLCRDHLDEWRAWNARLEGISELESLNDAVRAGALA